jgi:hypothetical protein
MKIKRYIPYKNITFCCRDCGTKICLRTAFYGKGTCWSCSKVTKNLSKITRLRRSLAGKGRIFSKISRLKISLSKIGKKLSKEHRLKLSKAKKGKYIGKNNPMFGVHLFGKNNPNFKGGLPNCIICKKQLGRRDAKRCKKCFGVSIKGKNNSNWQNGLSLSPYSNEFNNSLKQKIRCRDGYKCQICNKTEEQENKENSKYLSVHHIDYNKENCKEKNLISLCNKCHMKTNYNRKKWIKYFK